MGRNGWLDAVKKALRSPTKQMYNTKTLKARMREEDEPQVDQDKKSSKRRWIFKKTALHETTTILHDESSTFLSTSGTKPIMSLQAAYPDQEKDAIATTTTSAAAEVIIRLTSPSFEFQNHNAAALLIQTSFRRYLARRALEALKGVVKLQALVRGHNVRRRTKMTLKCMQALVRVQTQVCDQRRKLISNAGSFKDPAYTHSNTSWDERRDTSVKTVQVDTCSQRSSLSPRWKIERSQNQTYGHQQQRLDSYPTASSPLHYHRFQSQSPITPSSPNSRIKPSVKLQHSASPRCLRSGTQTPSYMSATVSSAMSQIRTQSTPRQRKPATDDQGEKKTTSARKRLSFNVSEKYNGNGNGGGVSDSELDCNSLRSPIHMMERRLSMSSCYKQRIEGDISRPSISQDRSWFR